MCWMIFMHLLLLKSVVHIDGVYRVVVVTKDGSTLVTNAALRRPPSVTQRHQCDYAFHCLELRSVENTAAPNDDSLALAVDATSVSKPFAQLRAVGATEALKNG
jgi:hypothetical protein